MKKIKIGVVGLQYGASIIKTLSNDENTKLFEIAAVCDLVKEKADSFAQQLGAKGYYDMDEMLKSDIDAVAIITEPRGRANLVRKAIRAGKHVMTTKPFELDADETMSVLNEAAERGLIVHANSPAPVFTEDLQIIDDWHKQYDLGRPIGCQSSVWANYREEADDRWLNDPERCPAAPIFRLGIYLINDMVRLLGEADSVTVMQSRIFTGRDTSDNAQLGIAFKNGAMAQIFASFCINDNQPYKDSMIINYERGTVYRDVIPTEFQEVWECKSFLSLVRPGEGIERIIEHKQASQRSDLYLWDVFYKAVNGEKIDYDTSPEQIQEGVKIIAAMAAAAKSGKVEKV